MRGFWIDAVPLPLVQGMRVVGLRGGDVAVFVPHRFPAGNTKHSSPKKFSPHGTGHVTLDFAPGLALLR